MIFEKDLVAYLNSLKEKKAVVYAGDLNVAHEEIDLKNPSTNHHNAGFTDEERNAFTNLLNNGYIDTFVSENIIDKVKDSKILNEIYGSDHCPVELEIDID